MSQGAEKSQPPEVGIEPGPQNLKANTLPRRCKSRLLPQGPPNFRVLYQVVAEISDRKNVLMYYIRVKEGRNEKLKKEGEMRISISLSIYTVHFAYLKVYTKF